MRIQIVCHDNSAGLSKDRQITYDILKKAGHDVYLTNNKVNEFKRERYDVNIFHEIIENKYYNQAKVNVFFPNPEWYFERMFKNIISGIDLVCCKTRDCETIFKRKGLKTIYTSFTSEDRRMEMKKEREFIHTCGKSVHKGTSHIKMAWQKDHNLPMLHLVESDRFKPQRLRTSGLNHIIGRLSNEKLQELQNKCWFHLYPSKYEGFGHAIWEAKSCGGVVLTTNAPPMDEFITEEMGILVNISKQKRNNWAVMKDTHNVLITEAVHKAINLKDDELEKMGKLARQDWERNDKFFRNTLTKMIKQL